MRAQLAVGSATRCRAHAHTLMTTDTTMGARHAAQRCRPAPESLHRPPCCCPQHPPSVTPADLPQTADRGAAMPSPTPPYMSSGGPTRQLMRSQTERPSSQPGDSTLFSSSPLPALPRTLSPTRNPAGSARAAYGGDASPTHGRHQEAVDFSMTADQTATFSAGIRQSGWLWKRFGHGHKTAWKRLWVRGRPAWRPAHAPALWRQLAQTHTRTRCSAITAARCMLLPPTLPAELAHCQRAAVRGLSFLPAASLLVPAVLPVRGQALLQHGQPAAG